MIVNKLNIRTLANEWYREHYRVEKIINSKNNEHKSYKEIISFLKTKYKVKKEQTLSDRTAFEIEYSGYIMDIFVKKAKKDTATLMPQVVCHFGTDAPNQYIRTSVFKLTDAETQLAIQKKFPELFDNNTVYFVSARELPLIYQNREGLSYDCNGITNTEFSDKNEAIEAARILATELADKNKNCCTNSRKRESSIC